MSPVDPVDTAGALGAGLRHPRGSLGSPALLHRYLLWLPHIFCTFFAHFFHTISVMEPEPQEPQLFALAKSEPETVLLSALGFGSNISVRQ